MRPFLVLLLAAALAASACSGSSSDADAEGDPQVPPPQETTPQATEPQETTPTVPARRYRKAELPKLTLQPADAPQGMRYTKVESGPKTLFDVGIILDDQVEQIRGMGIRGIYDAIFDSTTSDVRLTCRTYLFAEKEGAERWFEKTRSDQQLYGFQEIDAPLLGQDSWAAEGNIAAAIITYAFRTGNVVVVTSYSTQTQELAHADALAAARRAEARVTAA